MIRRLFYVCVSCNQSNLNNILNVFIKYRDESSVLFYMKVVSAMVLNIKIIKYCNILIQVCICIFMFLSIIKQKVQCTYSDTILINTMRTRDCIIRKTIFNTCVKVQPLLNYFIILLSDSGRTQGARARTPAFCNTGATGIAGT